MDSALDSDQLVDLGEAHHKAGRLQEAEVCYQQALEIDPGHPGALYYLANIAYGDGRTQFAAQLIERLLQDEPNDAEALHLWAMIAISAGQLAVAAQRLQRAVEIQPTYTQALLRLGDVYAHLGHLDEAQILFQRVLALEPNFADAHFALGNIYLAQGKNDLAAASYQTVISINPQAEFAYIALANAYRADKKIDQQIEIYKNALHYLPNSAPLNLNLGTAYVERKQFDAAMPYVERAVAINPDDPQAHGTLGVIFQNQGQVVKSEREYRRVVELTPGNARSLIYLADALKGQGKAREAIECWRKAGEIDPDYMDAQQRVLNFSQYLPDINREQVYRDHIAFAEKFEGPLRSGWKQHVVNNDPNKRLRIGFVSADLYAHPVGYFSESIFKEIYTSDAFDIFIYAMDYSNDALTDRLRACVHSWRSVLTLSDEALASQIIEDQIDILVDLSGHTQGNRLLAFARKPAPIQVSWLGYWETTGFRSIDYIFCDEYSVMPEEDKYFVEKPWRLPNTRLCFSIPDEAPAVAALPALSNGCITFGCFNNILKLNPRVIALWSEILKRLPSARLLLKWPAYAVPDIRDEIGSMFVRNGVKASQLIFEGSSPRAEYFAAYSRIDIALDPFPFPGGTTSVEGLWMGVPMLTLKGDRIISRQGVSIYQNIGMHDWIANSEAEYIDKAVIKAQDIAGLALLRGQIRSRLENSPLCDSKLFANNLVAAFQQMWKIYCAK